MQAHELYELASDQELSNDSKPKIQCIKLWKLQKLVNYFTSRSFMVSFNLKHIHSVN